MTWQNIAIFKLGKEVWWILKTLKYQNFIWIHCVWMSTISQAFGSNSCVRAEFTPEFSIERKKATKRQPLTNQSVTERKKKVTIKATSSLHYTIPRLSFLQSGIGLFANTKKIFFLDSALTSQICFDLPRGCFICILDSSYSRSFMIWSRWLASSSRSNWTGILTSKSNGSWIW